MPPTTTYQDLPASYSAVCEPFRLVTIHALEDLLTSEHQMQSFNFPAQCDSTLLTPISGSSSPPLQSLTKSSRRYGVSGSPEQQPSPPVNTTMLPWYYSTGSRPNQTASPLHQSTGSEFAAPAYMPENRRTPMPPIQQYVGTYGVSNAQEYQHNPYYQDQHEGSSPDVLDTRMHMNTQRGSVGAYSTGMTLPSQHLPDYRGSEATLNFSRSLDPGGMSNTPRQRGVRGARAQRARGRGGDTGRNSNHVGTRSPALSDWQNCHGKTVPPTLEDGIPEVERLLYELRWEHRDDKGQDMWRKIQGKIEDQLKFPLSAAALQMRYQRSRSAYIRWLDLDVSARSFIVTPSLANLR